MEPPRVKFLTRIYHPNIDDAGRICLDLLKAPPTGTWSPASNVSTVLQSIQLLMNEPNPDDALMHDIATQFREDRVGFESVARQYVLDHATGRPPTDIMPPSMVDASADAPLETATPKSSETTRETLGAPAVETTPVHEAAVATTNLDPPLRESDPNEQRRPAPKPKKLTLKKRAAAPLQSEDSKHLKVDHTKKQK